MSSKSMDSREARNAFPESGWVRRSCGSTRIAATLLASVALLSLVAGNACAEDRPLEIITTPIATGFVNAISSAANMQGFGLTEMNSVPALEDLCANKETGTGRVVLTAMTIPPGIAESCAENGIHELFEAQLGFLTLVLVQKSSDPAMDLTAKQLFMALAKTVPEGEGLGENKAVRWNEVDPTLPESTIRMIMAPRPGVTRSIFEAEAMVGGCRQFSVVKNIYDAEPRVEVCTTIRESVLQEVDDGAERLEAIRAAEPGAVGLIPINAYQANKDWLRIIPFEGLMPTPEDINAEDYNLASPIFVYADAEEIGAADAGTALRAWMDEALGEAAIGEGGYVEAMGLTPLPSASREWQRQIMP